MLTRENLTGCRRRRKTRSRRTTAGTLMTTVTDRTVQSYSSSTSTFPRARRVSARCHETTLIGSYAWLRTSVRESVVVEVYVVASVVMVASSLPVRMGAPAIRVFVTGATEQSGPDGIRTRDLL